MAGVLPPPPSGGGLPYAWQDWYLKLHTFLISAGSILWSNIDFTGSNITSIATRQHNDLQGIQGGTAGEYYHLTNANYTKVTGLPSTFVSSVFGRTGIVVATTGDYSVGQVTGAAPLASPPFTGTPTAPTALSSNNSTTIATTAYVKSQSYITGNQTITLSGDITGSGTTAITTTLANIVTGATNTKITYNAKGLITAGAQAAASDLSNGTIGTGTIVLANTPTLITPVIGVATGTSLSVSGLLKSSSAIAGLGYATGAGGAVTQLTSKATGVTLNTVSGQITMNGAALLTTAIVSFTLTNSSIAATDTIIVHRASAGTAASYNIWCDSVAAGSCVICVRNLTVGSLSEAIVLNYNVIKGVNS